MADQSPSAPRWAPKEKVEDGRYWQVDPALVTRFGLHLPVYISNALSTRLEVPDEFQGGREFSDRLLDVISGYVSVFRTSGRLDRSYVVQVESNLTGVPEPVRVVPAYDAERNLIALGFPEDAA